jgi:DNA topoisomerase I
MSLDKKILTLIENTIKEFQGNRKWYNSATGNYVGYARALALGLLKPGERPTKQPERADYYRTASGEPIEKKKKKGQIKKTRVPQWYDEFKRYKLNAYPINIPREEVKVNLEGDIHSHAVMIWKDPKTSREKRAYTEKFMQRNENIKWSRIKNIKPTQIDRVIKVATKLLNNKNPKLQQVGAIISIIAQTGLRPGSIKGFEETGNRGVSTLSADNLTINGSEILLNFTGKSHQENEATIRDTELAAYLKKRIEEKREETFLFDVPKSLVDKVYDDHMKMKDFKLKDMRTWFACQAAIKFLNDDKSTPPPLPENQKEIKKVVKDKLNRCFEHVSDLLNNTPTMARTSYVHPVIIKDWLKELGVKPIEVNYNESEEVSLGISEEDDDFCQEYLLPEWWFSDEIDLVPINSL